MSAEDRGMSAFKTALVMLGILNVADFALSLCFFAIIGSTQIESNPLFLALGSNAVAFALAAAYKIVLILALFWAAKNLVEFNKRVAASGIIAMLILVYSNVVVRNATVVWAYLNEIMMHPAISQTTPQGPVAVAQSVAVAREQVNTALHQSLPTVVERLAGFFEILLPVLPFVIVWWAVHRKDDKKNALVFGNGWKI